MSARNSVKAFPMLTFDAANLAIFFKPFPGSPLPGAVFHVRILNTSNQDVYVSYDGVNAHEFVPKTNGLFEVDFQTNSQPNGYVALLSKNSTVYLLGTAGVGFIYLSGYYQAQQ